MGAVITRMVLGLVTLGLGLYAILGKKPWETKWAERVAAGKVPGFQDYLYSGMWWGAVINLAVLIVLLGLSRWWLRSFPAPPQGSAPVPLPQWFPLLLVAVVGLSLLPRLPRMNQSFWGDEEWAFRKCVHGDWKPVDEDKPSGEWWFKPAPLAGVFFSDKDKNNHYLFSALQRGVLAAWRSCTGQPRWAFDEAL